jgi:hypothetical protein
VAIGVSKNIYGEYDMSMASDGNKIVWCKTFGGGREGHVNCKRRDSKVKSKKTRDWNNKNCGLLRSH